MISRRIPLDAMQKALYKRLTECQTVPVYDNLSTEGEEVGALLARMPFITFGPFTYKPDGTKGEDVARCTFQLDVWSAQSGRLEVQEITNDIVCVLEFKNLELDDDFEVVDQGVDFFESFEEEPTGYHGVITFVADVLNNRRE